MISLEKVLLIDDPLAKIPNHALMKISSFHKRLGHTVGFDTEDPTIIYASCIFKDSLEDIENLLDPYDCVINRGGTGYGNPLELPDVIMQCKPDYDLYPSEYSQGYTTRGCTKNCSYCIVREKEGKYRHENHVSEFYDDRFDTVMIMDNNWLADKEWFFENTDFILEKNLKVLEHGMDVTYLDEEIVQRLKELRFPYPYKFAFDEMKDEKAVLDGIDLLRQGGLNVRSKVMFYVLVGYNTSFEEDLYRVNLLKENGTSAYVMRYSRNQKLNRLARWVNFKPFFWAMNFHEYQLKECKHIL